MSSDALEGLLAALADAGGRAVLDGTKLADPVGLSARRLARLTLPDGKPVGGSLARWLGYSHGWLELIDVGPRKITWRAQPLAALIREELARTIEGDAEGLVDDIVASLPASGTTPAALLPPSASQSHFVLLTEAGELDYPVCAMEKENAWVTFTSFGDYLDAVVVPDPPVAPKPRAKRKKAAKKKASPKEGAASGQPAPAKRKKPAPRRTRLKRLDVEEAAALSDDALVDYGIKLAELGKHLFRMYFLTGVVALLEERKLDDGLYRVLRAHYECSRDARIRLLAPMARVGLRHDDPHLCEHAIATFIKEARRDPTNLYAEFRPTTKAIAGAAAYLGGDHDKLFDAIERTICFDGPTFAEISPHPVYEPLWRRASMQARYPALCQKHLASIAKKKGK